MILWHDVSTILFYWMKITNKCFKTTRDENIIKKLTFPLIEKIIFNLY